MKAKVNLSRITFIVIAQFVILLISSCIIGITSFYSKRDSISEMLKANTNQVAELLGKDLNSIYTIADNSYLNISVQQALQRDNAQESSVYEKYCTHQLLESLSTSHPAISDMIIYPLIGEPYHIQNDIVGIQNCYELREKKWFKQISKLESGFTLLPEENGLIIKGIERPYSVFGRTIYASSSRKIIGYQFLVVNTKWIETVSQNEKAVMQYYVCDNKNIPLLLREQEKKKFQISEREGYFTEESLINNNLKVVGHYARSYLLEESCKSIIIVLICMSPVMLLSLFCSSIWIKWIKRPTLELTGVMKQIEQGDFCIQLPHSQVEEINALSVQFSRMLTELSIEKEQNRKLEMRFLLSQLNPHFLYNTLNSIYWMILDEERAIEACEMVDALSNLLRYGLYEIDAPSTVGQELEHVEQYLLLQSKRYEDRFCYFADVPKELQSLEIPKLTFQPIVENAIKHSVEFHMETVEIKLTAKKENGIISFCFSNNYAELKPIELENLKRKFTEDYRPNETEVKSLGIGLYNVYRRLKLMYGSNAELQVHYENHMFMLVINIKTEAKGRKET
ncbi:sensor histidine kinase [Blautia faecis]|uniref:GHKL domain-containing protein n=1 Tax=Blautia faecis TaxID=871665 RepID=A0ABX2H796_9FIRM|nr:histidine kinase [Blautia faecis]NSG85954.1 GHKL domain-containing protein [Blautia faecis]